MQPVEGMTKSILLCIFRLFGSNPPLFPLASSPTAAVGLREPCSPKRERDTANREEKRSESRND